MVNGLKTLSEGGGSHVEMAVGWRDQQCFGRPIERKDGIVGRVTPPQSESSIAPENHEREEKKRENTKTQKEERFTLVRKLKKRQHRHPRLILSQNTLTGGFTKTFEQSTKAPSHCLEVCSHSSRILKES